MCQLSEPANLYGRVAEQVEKLVEADLTNNEIWYRREAKLDAEGNEIEEERIQTRAELARMWKGHVTRKLVKRNVMTTCYGVTSYGKKEQILAELEKDDVRLYEDGRSNTIPVLYLVEHITTVINGTVKSAKLIMDWIRDVADLFAKAGQHLTWITPTGFPVVQVYYKKAVKRIDTFWGPQRVSLSLSLGTTKPNGMRQKSGSSPNFIHSLDAAHCVKTTNRCASEGIECFSMIHDSYGTHAADMEKMSRLLREEFVALYTRDLLSETADQWKAQLPIEHQEHFPSPPLLGTYDVCSVMSADYFFC
jgi:DNA-directed RNA polymerase